MNSRLSKDQRNVLAAKLMDWGNLAFTGLVIAQFVPGAASFHWSFVYMGLLGIVLAYTTGILVMKTKGGEKN